MEVEVSIKEKEFVGYDKTSGAKVYRIVTDKGILSWINEHNFVIDVRNIVREL